MAQVSLYVTASKKQSKDGKNQWINFRTPMNLVVEGEEEKGIQHTYVDLVFVDAEDKARAEKMKGRFKITCEDTEVNAPFIYRIREKKDKDGNIKKEYPKVFVQSVLEMVSAPKPVKQELFTQDEE